MSAIEHDALKRFVKATEEFESRFGAAVIGLSGPKSQNGETYVEYLNGRTRVEFSPLNDVFPTADGAIDHTFDRLAEIHPADPALTLIWRVKPELGYFEPRSKRMSPGFRTYCRFVLSDKPLPVNNG